MSITAETLVIGPAPHLHSRETVAGAMKNVTVALMPAVLVALYIFGLGAVLVITVCVAGALMGEVTARRLKGEEPTLHDGTALVTGLLLALTLPPTAWWAVVPLYTLGGFLATAVFREYMGGLGWNRFNPALAARLFLLIGRTSLVYMAPLLLRVTPFLRPYLLQLEVVDAVSKATPLMLMVEKLPLPSYGSFLFAYKGGALAETSVLALLLGGAYLIYKKEINWHIPVSIMSTVMVFSFLFGADPIFHLLSGGLMLGAFFMATDWVTSPITDEGSIIFGMSIGILVVFFRLFASAYWVPAGGVLFSILILNACVPFIDRITRRRKFGHIFKKPEAN
jgi:Na+-translocating ferredoxin:NAD+ oxidoreductase subunit D